LGKPVDIMQVDIAGVRLGMSVKQVIAALKKHFNADDSQIKTGDWNVNDELLANGNRGVGSVAYLEKGQEIVNVSFAIKIPVDNSEPEAASRIQYSLIDNEPNRTQMLQSTITKYGAPTAYDNTTDVYQWCAYNPAPAYRGGPSVCDILNKSNLNLSRTKLTLADPSYAEKIAQEKQRRQTQKPKF
jgi:hypothetical protein